VVMEVLNNFWDQGAVRGRVHGNHVNEEIKAGRMDVLICLVYEMIGGIRRGGGGRNRGEGQYVGEDIGQAVVVVGGEGGGYCSGPGRGGQDYGNYLKEGLSKQVEVEVGLKDDGIRGCRGRGILRSLLVRFHVLGQGWKHIEGDGEGRLGGGRLEIYQGRYHRHQVRECQAPGERRRQLAQK